MSSLQRDIDWVDDHMEHASDVTKERWQRLRQRLTPDRERVARAIHDANTHGLRGEDFWIARADAAIAAMGEP